LRRLWRAGAGAIVSIEDPAVIGKVLAQVGEGQAPMPSLLVLRPEPRESKGSSKDARQGPGRAGDLAPVGAKDAQRRSRERV
jgi:hypothetical protein